MKAWRLEKLGGELTFKDVRRPQPRLGAVVVRLVASSLMSYMQDYVEGKLSVYHAPNETFTPGGNGVGFIEAVGPGVWSLKPGQRVVLSAHYVAQENVPEPGQILLGVTAVGSIAERMQSEWPDGTLAEYVEWPASAITVADGLDDISDEDLAISMRFVVPYGGMLKAGLCPGESIVVSGATGAYGSAAVIVALAMGAARVVAFGRDKKILAQVAALDSHRVVPCTATGDVKADAMALRAAAGRAPSMAFDQVGAARDPNTTLAALNSLAQGGRLVLMGSMTVDLPISYTHMMMNSWQIMGQFMYPREAYGQLLSMIRSRQLHLDGVRPVSFPLHSLRDAMKRAAHTTPFECVVMKH
jgi:alcohol dehydrogenase